jgi:hypothetical protein
MDDNAAAFERLRIAMIDADQLRRLASVILACRNADSLSGFDLSDIFAVDRYIARDLATAVQRLAESTVAEYRAPR